MKFIQAYPYTDTKQFRADISSLWKAGEDEKAVNRLKYLSASLILRRPKGTISLPPRRDVQYPVDFSTGERQAYEEIRNRAIVKINEALQSGSDPTKAGAYVNVLQQIESLRLTCDLGLHYHTRHREPGAGMDESRAWESAAQQAFNSHREMGPVTCLHCASNLDLGESLLDDDTGRRKEPRFFRCLRFCCPDCTRFLTESRRLITCGHSPQCPVAPVSLGGGALEEVSLGDAHPQVHISLPSKVQALVEDINGIPHDVKWCVFLV